MLTVEANTKTLEGVKAHCATPESLRVADCGPIDMAFLPSYPDAYLTNMALRMMSYDEQAALMVTAYLHLSDCLLAHEADAGDEDATARLREATTQGCKFWTRWCEANPVLAPGPHW